jgi:hypothetical protein
MAPYQGTETLPATGEYTNCPIVKGERTGFAQGEPAAGDGHGANALIRMFDTHKSPLVGFLHGRVSFNEKT